MVAASSSLPGVVLPGSITSTVAAAVMVLAAILEVMAEASPVVSLAAPPPPIVAEEEKEIEAPASLGGGLHGSPLRSKPKAPGGDMAGTELERPSVAREAEVGEIPSDDEADDVVELPAPSRELAGVRSEARPSGRMEEGDMEWPYPEDPSKVQFVLRDSQECQLRDILGGRGLAMESNLAKLSVKLEDAQE